MDEILLDSDILIDHLRGYEPARQYLKRFEAGEVQGYLSIITVAELAAGQMRQEEEEAKVHQLPPSGPSLPCPAGPVQRQRSQQHITALQPPRPLARRTAAPAMPWAPHTLP